MVAKSDELTDLADEFALVGELTAEAGIAADSTLPRVRRGWVNVPTGGHVSGVFWGDGPPELVFLHDVAESARAWDAVALAAGRPSVAIDLPGHGRSDWRRDGRYEPGKLAPAVAEAIRSFAPRARLVAGTGLGGLTAIALHRRNPRLVAQLALVDTLPVTRPDHAQDDDTARQAAESPERFASREEALAVLAGRRPERGRQALRREVLYELVQDPNGSWGWRHHPGNLPARPAAEPDDEALWDELAGFSSPVALIRGDWGGPLAASDLAALRQRVPRARVITIAGTGADLVATQPAALAAALGQLLATEPVRPS